MQVEMKIMWEGRVPSVIHYAGSPGKQIIVRQYWMPGQEAAALVNSSLTTEERRGMQGVCILASVLVTAQRRCNVSLYYLHAQLRCIYIISARDVTSPRSSE